MAKQKVRDEGRENKYFHQLPNMADDDLDPYEYRLFGHYKRVCGESEEGECWESTRTTARRCRMSTGKVTSTRRSLQTKGYIRIQEAEADETLVIRLNDLMPTNVARYSGKKTSWQGTSPNTAKPADSPLNAFLRGDALSGAWNATQFEESMSALLMHLVIELPNEPSLMVNLARNVDSPEQFFITLSRYMKAAALDCTICSSYATTVTRENIEASLNRVFTTRTGRSPGEHSVHEANRDVHHTNESVHLVNQRRTLEEEPGEEERIEEERESRAPESTPVPFHIANGLGRQSPTDKTPLVKAVEARLVFQAFVRGWDGIVPRVEPVTADTALIACKTLEAEVEAGRCTYEDIEAVTRWKVSNPKTQGYRIGFVLSDLPSFRAWQRAQANNPAKSKNTSDESTQDGSRYVTGPYARYIKH